MWHQIRQIVCQSVVAAVALAAAAFTMAAQASRPDSAATQDSARILGRVVVTATRTERSDESLPVSASVLPGTEVQSIPAQTLDDVLQSVPGINLPFENAVTAHPTANSLSMRGLSGLRTLMLVDGIPVNDGFFGYVPWNELPMELVDHVEVVRGANSNLFGTFAMGGVINVITRTPRDNELDPSVSYGSNGTMRGDVFGSTKLSDALRLTVNENYFNTDGYVRPIPSEAGPIDTPSSNRAQNFLGRLNFTPDSMWRAYVQATAYEMRQNQGSPLQTDGQQTTHLSAGAERLWAGGGLVKANLFYQTGFAWTDNADPITARGVDEFLSNIHQTPETGAGGSIQWSQLVTSARSTVTAGVDARSLMGEDRADNYSAPGQFSFREVAGGAEQTLGVFAQDDWFPTDPLEIIASARFDAWRQPNGHDVTSNGGTTLYATKSKSEVSPRVSARYRLTDEFSLRGSAYEAFNAPTLDELYRHYTAQSFGIIPNANLGPETLVGGEAGVEYARHNGAVQFNVFQSTVRDAITDEAVAYSPAYIITPFNVGQLRSRGWELFGDWAPASRWLLTGSYTYTQSVITQDPQDSTEIGKSNPDVPRDVVMGTVAYTLPGRLGGFVRGRYYTSRFTDATNDQQLSPFFVLDVSASAPIGSGFEAYVEVENLLNRLYIAENVGFDARGTPRQLFVGARATFRQ